MCMSGEGGNTSATVQLWISEGKPMRVCSPSPYEFWVLTQTLNLGGKHLYHLSHAAGPKAFI